MSDASAQTAADRATEAGASATQLPTTPIAEAPGISKGATLGRYLVIATLGRGGMGLVLRAYDPKLQREVALKVVRTDAMADNAQARLVREARAMAKLSHPNVVAVYDVELETGEGVVLVMEYVPGTTLRAWLEQPERDWVAIVEHFCAAGRGLAAAHVEGLLHRDFKPENVLVGSDGRVRVTDFGLARRWGEGSTSQPSADLSSDSGDASEALTQAGVVVGTFLFMAPEQHRGLELSAATDQYAFCVALWAALTGVFPFVARKDRLAWLKSRGPPDWPTSVVVPRRIVDALRRGLDPDPRARWPTMNALLAELVTARAPARRRAYTLPAAIVAVGSIGFGSWWATSRTPAPCQGARTQLGDAWTPARHDEMAAAVLGTNAAFATATWERIGSQLHRYADDWVASHTDACEATAVRGEQSASVLDLRMACLRHAQSQLRATVDLLANADAQVVVKAHALVDELPDLAACADVDALQSRLLAPPADAAAVVEAVRAELALVHAQRTAGRFASATATAEHALASADAAGWPPLRNEVLFELGQIRERMGDYEGAQTILEEALRESLRREQWGIAQRAAVELIDVVGYRQRRHDAGLAFVEVARGLVARAGNREVDEADLAFEVGLVRQSQGRYAEAEAEHRRSVELRERAHGALYRTVGSARNALGTDFFLQGRHDDAIREFEATLSTFTAMYGPDHPDVAGPLINIAGAYLRDARYDDAERAVLRAIAIFESAFGREHPEVGAAYGNLGGVYLTQERYEQAEQALANALAIASATLAPDHADLASAQANHAIALRRLGRLQDAERALSTALRIREKALGPEHPEVASTHLNLGNLYASQARHDEAMREHAIALAIYEKTLAPDHVDIGMSVHNLAMAHYEMGQHAEAERACLRALQIFERAYDADHPLVIATLVNVAASRLELGRTSEAIGDVERALARYDAQGDTSNAVARARFTLARALWQQGDRTRARAAADMARITLATNGTEAAEDREMAQEIETWLSTRSRR